jgi:hypothetical protein
VAKECESNEIDGGLECCTTDRAQPLQHRWTKFIGGAGRI